MAEVAFRATPPPPKSSGRWKKTCGAISADTGRSCALLEGHDGLHAHGRHQFRVVAAPGQLQFPHELALQRVAVSRPEVVIDA